LEGHDPPACGPGDEAQERADEARQDPSAMTPWKLLWRALDEAKRPPPGDLAAALGSLPEVGRLPSPWATWTLIGLVRHRRRQLWVAEVVATRLRGDPALAQVWALERPPDRPQHGLVPGLPEWVYFFHGIGCCLTNRITGESIDVDFYGQAAEYCDEFFYLNYLRSLRQPEPPEARLIALHPSFRPLRLAIGELLEAGLLVPLEDGSAHSFRLSEEILDHAEALDAFCQGWERADRRAWLGALIGDWLAAQEAAVAPEDEGIKVLISDRAAACRTRRCDDLLAHRVGEPQYGEVLLALDDLDAGALGDRLARTLRRPIDRATSTALEIIRRRDDPAWCPAVHRLFRRLGPEGRSPQPSLWVECLEFLLRNGYRPEEVRAALCSAGETSLGEAALLALEYAPESALPLFRRAVRSQVPKDRTQVAAILALIDRPWSRRELLAVLERSDDQEATAECRAALRESHDAEAHGAVSVWEEAHPYEPEPGPWITMGEMMLRNCPSHVRHEMERLHDRVMRVRDRIPGDSLAPRGGLV
jgi:hypothetical protein